MPWVPPVWVAALNNEAKLGWLACPEDWLAVLLCVLLLVSADRPLLTNDAAAAMSGTMSVISVKAVARPKYQSCEMTILRLMRRASAIASGDPQAAAKPAQVWQKSRRPAL